jgi:hypothetical protein
VGRDGRTLVEDSFLVSGSEKAACVVELDLAVQTEAGCVMVVPVLTERVPTDLKVLFDSETPEVFVRRRCSELGYPDSVAQDAVKGCAPSIGPAEGVSSGSGRELRPEEIEELCRSRDDRQGKQSRPSKR